MRKQTRARGRDELAHREENPGPGDRAISGISLHVGRSGEWIEPAEMLQTARKYFEAAAGETAGELVLDLGGLEHLDASALQVLLAIRAEQLRRDGRLRLANASESLRKWFAWAGADDLLMVTAGVHEPMDTKEFDLCAKS